MAFKAESCPILINCRDRVTPLRGLVAWLERAGHENITLIDNDSSWPPLLEFYERTPHRVVRLERNVGSRAIWREGFVPAEPFVYTDSDVIPTTECPLDAVTQLAAALSRHPYYRKAGLGLVLDDLPDGPTLEWERSLVAPTKALKGIPGAYGSLIDTTFALYEASAPFGYEAIRMGAPLQAVHHPWTLDGLSDEESYYLAHARGGEEGSSWRDSLLVSV